MAICTPWWRKNLLNDTKSLIQLTRKGGREESADCYTPLTTLEKLQSAPGIHVSSAAAAATTDTKIWGYWGPLLKVKISQKNSLSYCSAGKMCCFQGTSMVLWKPLLCLRDLGLSSPQRN